jgi:diguanylate cyclase
MTPDQQAAPYASPMEGRLGLALAAAGVGCWELDLGSGTAARSPVVDELYGFPPGTLGPEVAPFRERHHPGDEILGRRLFAAAVERGERHISYEYRILLPGGEIRWLSLHGEILPGPDGEPGRMIGILTDVTDRRRSEIALEESRDRLELAIGATDLGIWDWNVATGDIVLCVQARVIYGFSAEEPVGIEDLRRRIHPEDRDEVAEIRRRAFDPGHRGPEVYEYRVVRADGTVRWVSARGRTVFGEAGGEVRAVRCVGSLVDVTQRKEMEAELRETARHRQILLQELAHRVKNNLQVVAALLRLQADRSGDAAGRAQLLAAHGRVMAIAGVHVGQSHAGNPSRIDFAAYMRDLCEHAEAGLRNRDTPVLLALTIDPPAGLELDIDRAVPMGLIANELLSNALRHAFPDGRAGLISVRLGRDEGGALRLVVEDDGIGLPEPGQWTESRKGLGNVLARRLAKQIQAEIDLGIGPGARFEVKVPMDAAGAQAS